MRQAQAKLAPGCKHLGQGLHRAFPGDIIGKLVDDQIPGAMVLPGTHRQLESGDDQAPNQPAGLRVCVAQVEKQDFPLIHDLPKVQVIFSLAEHDPQSWVERKNARFVQNAFVTQGGAVFPPIKAVVEELDQLRVMYPGKALLTVIFITEQARHIHQGQLVLDQD